MAQCVSSPTRTSSGVGTTRLPQTTIGTFVTTPPGSLVTSLFTTCSTAPNSTLCAIASTVVTRPGTPVTTTGQVVVTVDAPYTYRTTLYGTSCPTVSGVVVSPTVSSSPVISTITSSSVYTSDGSTYVTVVTSLYSADIPESTTSDSPSSPSSSSSNDTSNKHIPAIVGGAIGGIALLALLAFLAWKFFKKPPILFDNEDYTDFNGSTKQEQGPSPYQYTPVGQESQTVAQAFPNDTGSQATGYGNNTGTFNNGVAGGDTFTQYTGPANNGVGPTMTGNEIGLQPGLPGNDVMYNVPNHGPVHQMPMPSLTPLVASSAAIAAAGPAARPNSTYSSTGYMPSSDPANQQTHYPSNLGYAPQQYPLHPSVLYPQQQPYGPPPMQYETRGPLSHHLSVGSTMSMSSSGAIGSSTGPGDIMPPLMIQPGQVYPHHPQSFGQSYGDSLSGSQSVGSAGPPESQILQVTNPGSDSFVQDSSTALATGAVAGPPPSTVTPSPPPIDGKGRPLDTQGEKAAMVHLDGSAYGESSAPAPPAYRE